MKDACPSILISSMKAKRALNINVKAQDRDGKPLEFEAYGYFAS